MRNNQEQDAYGTPIAYYLIITDAGGMSYQSRDYKVFKEIERVIKNYRSSPDCFKVELYKRYATGRVRFAGLYRRIKVPGHL